MNRLHITPLPGIQFGFQRQVRHPDDRVHRGADLVAHVGEELALCLVGRLCLVFCLLQTLVERTPLGDVLVHAGGAHGTPLIVAPHDPAGGLYPHPVAVAVAHPELGLEVVRTAFQMHLKLL